MDNVTEKIGGLVEILFPLDVIFEKLSIFFFGQRAVVPREILEGEHPTFACVVNCLEVADDPMVKVANVRVMDAVDDIVEEFIIESDVQLEKIINGFAYFQTLFLKMVCAMVNLSLLAKWSEPILGQYMTA